MKKADLITLASEQTNTNKALVFIHGFLCSGAIWDNFIATFKKDFSIYIVNLPGHNGGNSTVSSLESLAKSIALEIKSRELLNIHIIGHSLGGYLAGEIIKLELIKITSITLINSTLLADTESKKRERDLAIRAVNINANIFNENVW